MTTFIFSANRCLMLTREWPEELVSAYCPDFKKEQMISCRVGRWKGLIKCACTELKRIYDQAKQDAIDSAVEVDRPEDVTRIRQIIIGIGPDSNPQVDRHGIQEDTPYEVDVEMEIEWQSNYSGIWERSTFPFDKDHVDTNLKPGDSMTRQVARIKKVEPENSAHSYTEGMDIPNEPKEPVPEQVNQDFDLLTAYYMWRDYKDWKSKFILIRRPILNAERKEPERERKEK